MCVTLILTFFLFIFVCNCVDLFDIMALNHATIEKYLPKYEGDKDTLNFFIDQVTMLARAADADARALFPIILKSKLRGEAIKAIAHMPNSTVEEIVQALRLKFGDNRTIEQIIAEITRIRRFPNENPLAFANRLKELLYAAKNKSETPQATTILENVCIDQLCKNLDIATDRLIRSAQHTSFEEAFNHLKHETELHPEYFVRKQEKSNTFQRPNNYRFNQQQPFRPTFSNPPPRPTLAYSQVQQPKQTHSYPPPRPMGNQNPQHWTDLPRPTPEQWRRMYPATPQTQPRIENNDTDVSMRTVGNRSNRRPFNRPNVARGVEVYNTEITENSYEDEFFQQEEPKEHLT